MWRQQTGFAACMIAGNLINIGRALASYFHRAPELPGPPLAVAFAGGVGD